MSNPTVEAVVLAAGKGTRMKSDKPKVLHELAGQPLLSHVLETARTAGVKRTVVVVGHRADLVRETCGAADLEFVLQEPQLGTGHAVQMAEPALSAEGWTVVLAGDVPLLKAETLSRLIDTTRESGAVATVLTCVVDDAGAYGRIVKDAAGNLVKIVEARDASPEELAIGEYNSGVYCYDTARLRDALAHLTTDNDQAEYYLTDTIGWLVARGEPVRTVATDDAVEVIGINTIDELAAAEALYNDRHHD